MHNLVANPHHPSLRHSSFTTILKSLPLLAIAFAIFASAPLHAQARPPIHKVAPVYPPAAKQMGISGTVVVMATVDASGKVIKADSTSGNKILATAAIEAVQHWKFAPGAGTDTLIVSVDFTK
jgi:TonB family protein